MGAVGGLFPKPNLGIKTQKYAFRNFHPGGEKSKLLQNKSAESFLDETRFLGIDSSRKIFPPRVFAYAYGWKKTGER